MPTDTAELEANLDASCLLVLFIPSEQGTEDHAPIDQEYWVGQALDTLGLAFGGATAFPKGQGVWLDVTATAPQLLRDTPVVIQSYANRAQFDSNWTSLVEFLMRLGREGKQKAVGYVFNNRYGQIVVGRHYTWE